MFKNFRNIAVVSMSTMGSRVLGLVRDLMIFAVLGAGLWNSSFILAFTLPNLFRRLLGEGALTSAVVPVFSDVLDRQGREAAFAFFNQVLLRVGVLLLGTVIGGVILLACLNTFGFLTGRWSIGADLSVLLLPYMIFICLAAIVSAGLNVMGRFAAAACTPVLLNLAMIAALGAGWWMDAPEANVVYLLCGGVLLGGLLQLALPVWDLIRQGWRPRLTTESSEALEKVWELFLPGLLGAAILQVNILVSRLLAFTLDETAVSVLYLASRLMELPLGVFTVALVTVYFPLLAKAVSAKDKQQFAAGFNQGMRLIIAITLPAAAGLVVLAEPILTLFQWGAFEVNDVVATIPLLIIYGLGLPIYSVATFATRGLHARKDMHTPVIVAAFCLVTNAVAGFILMQFFGSSGLAAANVLAAFVQAALLWRALSVVLPTIRINAIAIACLKAFVAAALMAVACWLGDQWLGSLNLELKIQAAVRVGILVPAGVLVYFTLLTLLRFDELDALKRLIFRRKKAPVDV